MQIYIDNGKYYESMGGDPVETTLAIRMIKSGADLFVMEEAGKPVQVLNKYKIIDMLDCITFQIRQAKGTMEASNNIPRELCWDVFEKLGVLLREMPLDKDKFEEIE